MPGLGQGELKCLFIPLAAGKFKVIFNIFNLSKVLDQGLGEPTVTVPPGGHMP
jgi:hypothetical protein